MAAANDTGAEPTFSQTLAWIDFYIAELDKVLAAYRQGGSTRAQEAGIIGELHSARVIRNTLASGEWRADLHELRVGK